VGEDGKVLQLCEGVGCEGAWSGSDLLEIAWEVPYGYRSAVQLNGWDAWETMDSKETMVFEAHLLMEVHWGLRDFEGTRCLREVRNLTDEFCAPRYCCIYW
jgi:hypothetical protein